jgi:hypothetical protein
VPETTPRKEPRAQAGNTPGGRECDRTRPPGVKGRAKENGNSPITPRGGLAPRVLEGPSPRVRCRTRPPCTSADQTTVHFCALDQTTMHFCGPDRHVLLRTRPPCTSADQTTVYFCAPDQTAMYCCAPDKNATHHYALSIVAVRFYAWDQTTSVPNNHRLRNEAHRRQHRAAQAVHRHCNHRG